MGQKNFFIEMFRVKINAWYKVFYEANYMPKQALQLVLLTIISPSVFTPIAEKR